MQTLAELREAHDGKDVLSSIKLFKEQCLSGWRAGASLVIPEEYKKVKNIVIFGMGGSALPGWILSSWNAHALPIEVWNRYESPTYLGPETLAIAMSYSGTTEETLEGTQRAIEKGAKVLAITVGGTLEKICKEKNFPLCVIDAKTNPCGQPRFGVGFAMCALLGILTELGVFTQGKEVQKVLEEYQEGDSFSDDSREAQLAQKIITKTPVIIAGEHLREVAHFFQNQLNETGKTFALFHEIPEVNHHLLEGLAYPTQNKDNLLFIFLDSPHYGKRVAKRFAIMEEIAKKEGMEVAHLTYDRENIFSETFSFMEGIEYITYMTGLYRKLDPSDVPYVTYFKNKLAE